MSRTPPFQLAEVESWLDRYRSYRSERSGTRRADFKSGFHRLGEELKPLQARAAERAAVETADFNVFRVLRLARKEVITHTPFLANLLNPRGTHAQGDLFLRLFLDRLRAKQAHLPAPRPKARWLVLTEQVTELGNFDIRLWSHDLRCQIVIENKIGAGDQEDQLARYWKKMMKHTAQFDFPVLVYLTPSEREPQQTKEPLPPYTNLTYHEDICTLLESALSESALPPIQSPRLQHTLEQYLEIVRTS